MSNKQEGAPPQTVVNDDGCVCPTTTKKKTSACDLENGTFGTCPYDPRYPDANQTKHCFSSFVDYQRCARLLGTDYPGCQIFLKCYKSLCPNAWVERWYTQMENGTFPKKIYPPKPIIRPDEDDSSCVILENEIPPDPACP